MLFIFRGFQIERSKTILPIMFVAFMLAGAFIADYIVTPKPMNPFMLQEWGTPGIILIGFLSGAVVSIILYLLIRNRIGPKPNKSL